MARAPIDDNHGRGLIVRDELSGPALDVTGVSLTNANAIHVAIVDGSGNQITTFGGSGGTAATDDSAFTAGSGSGTPMMGFVTADSVDSGDVGVVGMLANRQLKVTLYDSGGSELSVGGGTQYTEDAAAAANPIGNALNLIRDDARGGSLTTADGDNVAARGTNSGELYVKHVDSIAVTNAGLTELAAAINASSQMDVNIAASGATLTVASHAVTNAGTFAVQESGAALTALQLIDDGVYTDDTSTHSTGSSKGYGVMAVATPTDASVNANDFGHLAMTTDRKLHVSVQDALPAGTNAIGKLSANSGVDIGDVDITSVIPGTGATNLGKAEDGAHTSGDVGVMALGVRADTPNATVAANGDYQYVAQDMVGGVRTALYETDFAVLGTNHVKKYYTNAGAVTDGIVWSPAAGKRWYVTDIFINVSAAATITLEDDLSGGDSAVWKAELAANSGWSHSFATPLFSGEDAADLLVTTSAGNVYVMVTGYEI